MVIILAAQVAVTPAGKPVAAPIPVAPVVVKLIADKIVFTPREGVDEAALSVLAGVGVTMALWQEPIKHNTTTIKMDFNAIGFIFLKI